MISHEELLSLYNYDPETGIFRHNGRRMGPKTAGKVAGHHRDGYVRIHASGKSYSAHRLAWFYVHGEWPKGEIDHINRVRDDNRIANLRDVDRSQNKLNGGMYRNNTSGHKGVYFDKTKNLWMVRYRGKFVGYFSDKQTAAIARANVEHV